MINLESHLSARYSMMATDCVSTSPSISRQGTFVRSSLKLPPWSFLQSSWAQMSRSDHLITHTRKHPFHWVPCSWTIFMFAIVAPFWFLVNHNSNGQTHLFHWVEFLVVFSMLLPSPFHQVDCNLLIMITMVVITIGHHDDCHIFIVHFYTINILSCKAQW